MLITPLDYLNYCKGRKISVETNHGTITGVLKAFDLNINLSLSTSNGDEFVKGESVKNVIITEKVQETASSGSYLGKIVVEPVK